MSGGGELAGALDQRVRFERRSALRGVGGDWLGGWELVGERWAAVELLSRASQSALVADALHSARRWRVTLRAGPALLVGMRMLWRGLELRVAGVEDDPGAPDRLVVVVEEFAA